MKIPRLSRALALCWLVYFPVHEVQAAPLSVTQGRAAQKAGTRLVDVNYDLSGGVPPYTVTLQGSLDGGTTWTLPVTTVGGNVGSGVTAGTNRTVTWNAGADWAGQISDNVKFRVNVTDSAVPVDDLIAYYSFDGSAEDVSGNGHNGVDYGALATVDRFGQSNSALEFNGTNAYVSIGNGINPGIFTITAWVWLSKLPTDSAVIISKLHNKSPDFYKNFEIRVEPNGGLYAHIPDGEGWPGLHSNELLGTAKWNHVTLTYDGVSAKIYLNGNPQISILYSNYSQSDVDITIGSRPEGGVPAGPSMFFPGRIDEVRIYNRVLSLAEISALSEQ